MSSIENIKGFGTFSLWHYSSIACVVIFVFPHYVDPFADAAKGDEDGVQDGLVHIRIQQRNGRKTLTTIQGLSAEYDLKKIVRACKKVF
jgi:translation initiation factor SUI1